MSVKKSVKKAPKKKVKKPPVWLVLGHTQQEAERVAAQVDADGVVLVVCRSQDLETGDDIERVIDPHDVIGRCSALDRKSLLDMLPSGVEIWNAG